MKKIFFLGWILIISGSVACMREEVTNDTEGTLKLVLNFSKQNESIFYNGTANLIKWKEESLSNRVCLTAAHCLKREDTNFTFDLGKSYAIYQEKHRIGIINYLIHEEYKGKKDSKNDIALILLEYPIFPIHFPYIDPTYSLDDMSPIRVSVCGFGITNKNGKEDQWEPSNTNYRKKMIVYRGSNKKPTWLKEQLSAYKNNIYDFIPRVRSHIKKETPKEYNIEEGTWASFWSHAPGTTDIFPPPEWHSQSYTTCGDSGSLIVDEQRRAHGICSGGGILFYSHPALRLYNYSICSAILGTWYLGNYLFDRSGFSYQSPYFLSFNCGFLVLCYYSLNCINSLRKTIISKINGQNEKTTNWVYKFFTYFHKVEESKWVRQSTFCSIYPHIQWLENKLSLICNLNTSKGSVASVDRG